MLIKVQPSNIDSAYLWAMAEEAWKSRGKRGAEVWVNGLLSKVQLIDKFTHECAVLACFAWEIC